MEEMFIVIGSGRFVRAKTAKDAILVAQDSHSLALFVHKNPVENNFSYSVLYDARESSTHLRESFCPNHIMYSLDLKNDIQSCSSTYKMIIRELLSSRFFVEITLASDDSESFVSAIGIVGEGSETYTMHYCFVNETVFSSFPLALLTARECAAFNNNDVRITADDGTFVTIFHK